jgi:hypothetical protein
MSKCQHPADSGQYTDTCDRKADWYTDDLQAVHWLCNDHKEEAEMFNAFEVDPA